MRTQVVAAMIAAVAIGLLTFTIVLFAVPAECAEDACGLSLCNDQIICPGACGCVKAPGQPWGRCHSY